MAKKGLKVCLVMSLSFLIIVTVIIVTLFLTVFKPKDPNIMVRPVGLENLDLSLLTNFTANVSLGMVITMGNPNYGSFEYHNATGYVNFHDNIVGEVPIKGELVPAFGQINVSTWANLMVGKLVNDSKFWSDVLSGSLNLTSTATLPGKAHMLKIFKLKATVYSTCDISLNIISSNTGVNVLDSFNTYDITAPIMELENWLDKEVLICFEWNLNFKSTTALPGNAHMFNLIKLKTTAYSNCDISVGSSRNVVDIYQFCIQNQALIVPSQDLQHMHYLKRKKATRPTKEGPQKRGPEYPRNQTWRFSERLKSFRTSNESGFITRPTRPKAVENQKLKPINMDYVAHG
ncbi:unnamed protein product [Sphenostylis stenocarpa]|uniref:Late embryogenesis abundant protein LEA-2 subgroup domain-containing protein n=1 Tax=Sphenostylis stenocarpa TaxID=92480 RepID=A0AA86SLZ9_9FABA|nr:unnamed protein product [Sphenostylis stenocarpa]